MTYITCGAPSASHQALRGVESALCVWEDSSPTPCVASFILPLTTACGCPGFVKKTYCMFYPFTQLFLSHVVPEYHYCHLESETLTQSLASLPLPNGADC